MYILTASELPAMVANEWRDTFTDNDRAWDERFNFPGRTKESVYDQLVALGEDVTAEQIEMLIGNNSWTTLSCSQCLDEGFDAVLVLENWDEEEVRICFNCVNDLSQYIEGYQSVQVET